jgi:dipeptidyl aminopeptidase/acylaminoacyl peptidase
VASRIRAPFLILHGTAVTTVPPERSALLKQTLDAQGVPNARHLFEGVGHGLPVEKSEEVSRLMGEWFTAHKVLLPSAAKSLPPGID